MIIFKRQCELSGYAVYPPEIGIGEQSSNKGRHFRKNPLRKDMNLSVPLHPSHVLN